MRRYAPPEEHLRLTLNQLAREINRTPAQTEKLLRRAHYLHLVPRLPRHRTTYPSSAVDVLKGLIGVPHRHVGPPGSDWLTQWLGEETNERGIQPVQHPDGTGPPGPADPGSPAGG